MQNFKKFVNDNFYGGEKLKSPKFTVNDYKDDNYMEVEEENKEENMEEEEEADDNEENNEISEEEDEEKIKKGIENEIKTKKQQYLFSFEILKNIIMLQNQTEDALRENSDLEEILKLQEKEIKNISLNNTNLLEEIQKNAFEIEEYKNGSIELDGNIDITQNAIDQLMVDIKNKNENEKKKKNMIEEREKEIRKYETVTYDNNFGSNRKVIDDFIKQLKTNI